MKKCFCLFPAVFFCLCIGRYATKTPDEIMQYVSIVENDPLSENAGIAYRHIVRFAEKSKNVTIVIDPKITPWIGNKRTQVLLGSYIAGNLKSQLTKNTNGNDAYSGILFVIHTYNLLKKNDPSYSIPEIEKQIELESKNELRRYLSDVMKETE
jgi:hypothetical protein